MNPKTIQTSEYCTVGHPDRTCDFIASYILDKYLEVDRRSRVALEVQLKERYCTISGEITSNAPYGEEAIADFAREAIAKIGYTDEYQERFGDVPNQFAADAYDCVYAYKQALDAAGATADMTAEQICELMKQQFTTMTFDGLTGEGMTWDADGAVTKSPKGMVIQNGTYVGLD